MSKIVLFGKKFNIVNIVKDTVKRGLNSSLDAKRKQNIVGKGENAGFHLHSSHNVFYDILSSNKIITLATLQFIICKC